MRRRRPHRALSEASEVWYRLSSLRERLRGTASLAADRVRLLGSAGPERTGGSRPGGPGRPGRSACARGGRAGQRGRAGPRAPRGGRRRRARRPRPSDRRREEVATALRGAADRREGCARLAGQVAARRSRVEATQDELGRLRESLAAAEQRGQEATSSSQCSSGQVAGVEAGEEDLDAGTRPPSRRLERATERLDRSARAAERRRAGACRAWSRRAETLELGLERKDGVGGAARRGRPARCWGRSRHCSHVDPENEDAIVAALGAVADAVAVDSATRPSRDPLPAHEDAGRATLLVAARRPASAPHRRPSAGRCRSRWSISSAHRRAAARSRRATAGRRRRRRRSGGRSPAGGRPTRPRRPPRGPGTC